MSQIIRVTTIDGDKKDFKMRDSIMAYSYYNSRQSRPGTDAEGEPEIQISEWKVYDQKFFVDGVEFEDEDSANKYRDERIYEVREKLDRMFPIETKESLAKEQPIEFPSPDWTSVSEKNVVREAPSEAKARKLEENKDLDGNIKARSFSSESAPSNEPKPVSPPQKVVKPVGNDKK